MAKQFQLTAQLKLQAPNNLKQVSSTIRKEFGTIDAKVNVRIDANANTRVKELTSSLKELRATLGSIKDTGNSITGATRAVNNLTKSVGSSASAVKDQGKAFKETAKNVQEARTEMEAFGIQSALAIRRFAAFSVGTAGIIGFVTAIKSGVQEAIKFDREMIRLSQVTGGSIRTLRGLSSEVGRLAKGFGVSSTELIGVSSTLAQAGLTIKETKIAMEALAKSSLAPSFDNLQNTTEGVIAAMRQFSLQATDVESALGSINSVAAAFAVESEDIITAIRTTGGVFASASKGVAEGKDALNQFISVFTSVRQTTRESAESIATGLRTIFTRIQRPRTIEFLKEFGVNLQDLEGKFVGPYEAIKRLSEGLSSLDNRSPRFAQITEELGGYRQLGKVIPAIQQFAVSQKALQIAQQGTNSLTEDAATAQQALAVQIAKTREGFLDLIRTITQSAAFNTTISGVLKLADGFIALGNALAPIIPYLTALAAIKSVSAGFQFGSGFIGGIKRGGGAAGAGGGLASLITGNKGFAKGGLVPGVGNEDSVLTSLMPGEFVVRKDAVKAIGAHNMEKINRYASAGPARPSLAKLDRFAQANSLVPQGMSSSQYKQYLRENPEAADAIASKYSGSTGVAGVAAGPKGPKPKGFGYGKKRPTTGDLIAGGSYGGLFFQLGTKQISNSLVGISTSKLAKPTQALLEENFPGATAIKGQPHQLFIDKAHGDQFDTIAKKSFKDSIKALLDSQGGAKGVASSLKMSESELVNRLEKQTGFEQLAGSLFEGYVSILAGQVNEDRGRTFDFNPASNDFTKLFGAGAKSLQHADAKYTSSAKSRASLVEKAVNTYFANGPGAGITLRPEGGSKDQYHERDKEIRKTMGTNKPAFIKRAGGGYGQAGSPALVMPGEFIVNSTSAKNLGPGVLNQLNNADKFANGGGYDDSHVQYIAQQLQASGLSAKTAYKQASRQVRTKNRNDAIDKAAQDVLNKRMEQAYLRGQQEGVDGIDINDQFSGMRRGSSLSAVNAKNAGLGSTMTGGGVGSPSTSVSVAGSSGPISTSGVARPAGSSKSFGQRIGSNIGRYGSAAAFVGAPLAAQAIGNSTPTTAGIGGALNGAVGGAALGASLGGPVGAAAGGALGAVAGLVTALEQAKFDEAAKRFQAAVDDFDSSITKGGLKGAEDKAGKLNEENITRVNASKIDGSSGSEAAGTLGYGGVFRAVAGLDKTSDDKANIAKYEAKKTKEFASEIGSKGDSVAEAYKQQYLKTGNKNIGPEAKKLLAFTSDNAFGTASAINTSGKQRNVDGTYKTAEQRTASTNAIITGSSDAKIKAIQKEVEAYKKSVAASKSATQSIEILADRLNKVSALTGRAGADSNNRQVGVEDSLNRGAGNFSLGRVKSQQDIFANNSAYSNDETTAAIKGLGLSKSATSSLTAGTLSTKSLTENLPKELLKQFEGGGLENVNVNKSIDSVLASSGLDATALPDELRKKITSFVGDKTGNSQQAGGAQGAEEFFRDDLGPALEKIRDGFLKAGGDLNKGLEEANRQYLENINNYIEQQRKYSETALKNTRSGAEDLNAFRGANGTELSFADKTNPEIAQLRGLSGINNYSVSGITDRRSTVESRLGVVSDRIKGSGPGGPSSQDIQEFESLTKELGGLNSAIDVLAQSTTGLAAIQDELAKEESKRTRAGDNQQNALGRTRQEAAKLRRNERLADQVLADPNQQYGKRQLEQANAGINQQIAQAATPEAAAALKEKRDKLLRGQNAVRATSTNSELAANGVLDSDRLQIDAKGNAIGGTDRQKELVKQGRGFINERNAARDAQNRKPTEGTRQDIENARGAAKGQLQGAGNTLGISNEAAASLEKAAASLAKIPSKIEMQGTHTVNVNMVGAEGLKGAIGELIQTEIAKAMKQSQPLDARIDKPQQA